MIATTCTSANCELFARTALRVESRPRRSDDGDEHALHAILSAPNAAVPAGYQAHVDD
jgi:hypothetical protein